MDRLRQCSSYQIDSNDPGEDRMVVKLSPTMSMFAVIDGHGGGGVASTLCAQYLIDIIDSKRDAILQNEEDPEAVSSILCDAFISCDSLILDQCKALSDASDPAASLAVKFAPFKAGCCALVLVLMQCMVYVVHVGDSRAVHCFEDPSESVTGRTIPPQEAMNSFSQMSLDMHKLRQFSSKPDAPFATPLTTDSGALVEGEDIASRTRSQRGYDVGGNNFLYTGSGLSVQGITLDHTCQVEHEVAVVKFLSPDPDPIRQSENDKRRFGAAAIPRVAGSLAVTRALGDGYLKRPDMSLEPFNKHLPYITCIPAVSYKKIEPTDVSIILASDGFWNFIKLNEVAHIVNHAKEHQPTPSNAIHNINFSDELAKVLCVQCLTNAASSCRMTAKDLLDMPPGPKRRTMIDDISVMVLLFNTP